jgi:hypothetical protein
VATGTVTCAGGAPGAGAGGGVIGIQGSSGLVEIITPTGTTRS